MRQWAGTRWQRLHTHNDRGAEALVAAIVWPSVLLAVFVIIQAAAYFVTRAVAANAAEAGYQAARVLHADPQTGTETAQQYVHDHGDGWGSFQAANATSDGHQVTVTVTMRAAGIVPGIDLDITQHAAGPVEDTALDPGGAP